MIGAQLQNLLDELEASGQENDRIQTDRSRKMLNLDKVTAQLVRALISGRGAKRILEIGTSNGYSTIWLAASLAPGGCVFSIDRNAAKHRLAETNLKRAGLLDRARLLSGNATDLVAALEGPFDAVFFDADRLSAPAQLALLLSKLSPAAMLLADNALSHPEEIAGYLAAIEALPDFEHFIVPVGKGLSVAHRTSRCGA